MTITFDIAGIPFPQPRPRITIRNGHAWAYHAPEVEVWKETVQIMTMSKLAQYGDKFINCPVALTLLFRLPRPKSLPKKITYHVKRPDLDNEIKSLSDAMTKAGAWKDDSQIFHLTAAKTYARPGEEGVTVIIDYRDGKHIGGVII
jgi:Holliday junction resolvase RusA-like endonuclease